MTQYIVTSPKSGATIRVETTSRDHARSIASIVNADDFTDGKDGVWLHVEEVRDAAAARFREEFAKTAERAGLSDTEVAPLLDLFQEALDESREAGWEAARDALDY